MQAKPDLRVVLKRMFVESCSVNIYVVSLHVTKESVEWSVH